MAGPPYGSLGAGEVEDLLTRLPGFVLVIGAEGNTLWVNRLDPTLRAEDVIGKSPFAYIPDPVYRAQAQAVLDRCLRQGVAGSYDVPGYSEGDWTSQFTAEVIPFTPAADGSARALLVASDTSEQHAAKRALQESQARYRRLIEESPDFVTSIDAERKIRYINRDPPPESGFTREDLVGLLVDDFIEPAAREQAVAVINEVLATGQAGSYEAASSKDEHHFRVKVVPLSDADGAPGQELLLVSTDITHEWRSAQRHKTMLAELDHRVKNVLASVVAMSEQTSVASSSLDEFRKTFNGRLRALAHTHEALSESSWQGVGLAELIDRVVGVTAGDRGRLDSDSASPDLPPDTVTPLSMALHELTTNAVKYGALSVADGQLNLAACIEEDGSLEIHWHERGIGPRVDAPDGLGLRLVRGLLEHELRGEFHTELGDDSRSYRIVIPLRDRSSTARDH